MKSGSVMSLTKRTRWRAAMLVLVSCTLLLAVCTIAEAAVDAYWGPSSVMVVPGEEFELSFRVGGGEDLIASFQLYVSFDPSTIELVEATEGSLYTESGYMTWFIEDEEYPGFWHFFDTVFGAGTHVTPPGELLHLRFRALQSGHTQAHVDTIRFTDQMRDPLAVGAFEHADVFVVPSTGVADSHCTVTIGPAQPNPFAGKTTLSFTTAVETQSSTFEIYDIRGRLVRRMIIPDAARQGELIWDGTDDAGSELPASVYFVRILSGEHCARTRVVKMR